MGGGVGDGGLRGRPVGGDEDDGFGGVGGEGEDFGDAVLEGGCDCCVVGVVEEGHGPAAVGEGDDGCEGHADGEELEVREDIEVSVGESGVGVGEGGC